MAGGSDCGVATVEGILESLRGAEALVAARREVEEAHQKPTMPTSCACQRFAESSVEGAV